MADASLQTSKEPVLSVGLNGGINREREESVLLSVEWQQTVYCAYTLMLKGKMLFSTSDPTLALITVTTAFT